MSSFDVFIEEFIEFQSKLKKFPDYLLEETAFQSIIHKNSFRIVLVGGVGVGKTSLLERLIETRLPKGQGLKRPLIIKKIEGQGEGEEHKISTSTASSSSDNIMPVVINSSTNRVHFEFVDLPGLTSMSRPDQPETYPKFTRELMEFYTPTADVILLCLPADADLVNSDALKYVKSLEIDDRVVCCLSKFDLLEDFKIQIESTKTFSGVVSLRNAPLLEMEESIKSTNQKEDQFFKENGELNFSCFGVEGVKKEILKIVKNNFNQIKNEISLILWKERIRLEKRLSLMKDPNFTLKLVTDYIEFINKEMTNETTETRISCGTKIGLIFWKCLPEALESVDILKGIDRENVKILIKNAQGLKTSLQFENAFKILLKSQLKISEKIIFDCLNLISRELREFLLVQISEEEAEEDDDEFYDVKSVSESEFEDLEFEDFSSVLRDLNIKTQLKLVPGLARLINKNVSEVLEGSMKKTRKYLDEYCEMQKEMVFCNESEYTEAFRRYYSEDKNTMARAGSRMSGSRVISEGYTSNASSTDELPLKRIESESLETLTSKNLVEDSSVFKEFLALLFPTVADVKRVEYRPKKLALKSALDCNSVKQGDCNYRYSAAYSDTTIPKQTAIRSVDTATRDEEFLLNLLEIYLKSYHRQSTDFLPKCINYHLIQATLKNLPIRLLECGDNKRELWGRGQEEEVKGVERVLKMIKEINV